MFERLHLLNDTLCDRVAVGEVSQNITIPYAWYGSVLTDSADLNIVTPMLTDSGMSMGKGVRGKYSKISHITNFQ